MGRIPTDSHFASRGTGPKGKMKTIYLVCLVFAGAALAHGWACENDPTRPTCVPIFKPPFPGEPGPKPNCPLCQVRAIAEKCTNPTVFVPACDGDDFRKYQFDAHKNERFCVNKAGKEFPKSRTKGPGDPKTYCNAFKKKDDAPPPKVCQTRKAAAGLKGAFIKCLKNGDYAPEQMRGVFHWCATRTGAPVPRTMSKEGGKRAKANCAAFRAFRFECKKDGFFVYSADCRRYVTCSGGNGHLCICPKKQAFDPKLKVCNWIENVKGCAKSVKRTEPQ